MKKKVFCILLCSFLIGVLLIPVFAYDPNSSTVPSDLGQEITDLSNIPNGFYYIKLIINDYVESDIIKFNIHNSDYSQFDQFSKLLYFKLAGQVNRLRYNYLVSANYAPLGLVEPLYYQNDYTNNEIGIGSNRILYLPFAIASRAGFTIDIEILDNINYTVNLYYMGYTGIDYDFAYMQGYLRGYDVGMYDAIAGHESLNLVQHVNRALGFFIGEENAQYVTPFAIAFTLLMAYFIFIRWILLFGKSNKALKIADIVVVAACIGIMAVMYINMFTINIHNTNVSESVYQIASDVITGG